MDVANSEFSLDVEVCDPIPLTVEEKAVFAPYLEKQGIIS